MNRPQPLAALALLLAAACAAACGASRDAAPVVATSLASESTYRALPDLAIDEISSACGADPEPCAKLAIPFAAVHPSGAIAFWGFADTRIQLYRAEAGTVIALGRQGGGPGEYRMPLFIGISDSGEVVVGDITQHRILRYASDGSVRPVASITMPTGIFDAAFVGDELRAFATELPSTPGDSMPVRIHRLSPAPKELFVLPTRLPGYAMTDLRPMNKLFAPQTTMRFRRDGQLFVAEGVRWELDHFDANGEHLARFGFDVAPPAVTDAEVAAVREERLRRIPNAQMRAAMEAGLVAGATRHPAVTALAPLPDGSIWVRESARGASDSVPWIVFRRAGEPRGRVMLAESEMVLGGTTAHILLARMDDERATALRWIRLREGTKD